MLSAVDLRTGSLDGLGAVAYYNQPIQAVQAEFECLPFEDRSFDLVVFNAAMHYSQDYATTLQESLRVLARDGWLAIIDTHYYHDPASGQLMVHERERRFEQLYWSSSNAVPLENFITKARMAAFSRELGLIWQFYWPDSLSPALPPDLWHADPRKTLLEIS